MTTPVRPIDLDAVDLDAIRAGVLRDEPITVLGLARSGIALARFLGPADDATRKMLLEILAEDQSRAKELAALASQLKPS